MTELLTRPPAATPSLARGRSEPGSLWWRGVLGALWAVAVGAAALIVVVLVIWATDARSGADAGEAMRAALQLWLVAHKVPMSVTGGGTIAIAPLGLTLALALIVARAAAVLARGHDVESPIDVGLVALAVGVPYSVLCAFVAAAANSDPVHPSPIAALGAGLVVGCGAAAWGAARGTKSTASIVAAVPPRLRIAVGCGARAVGVLLVAGFVLTLASLSLHVHAAAHDAAVLGGGVIASGGLFVLDALLLPNAAAAAMGYVSGPGFAVGTGTAYAQGSVHAGAMPSLPLLAAVPHGAASPMLRVLCIAVVVLAGVVAARRLPVGASVTALVQDVVAAGVGAGVLAAVAVAVADGPAGPGRMAAVGASPWQVGLVVAGEVALVALAATILRRWRALDSPELDSAHKGDESGTLGA